MCFFPSGNEYPHSWIPWKRLLLGEGGRIGEMASDPRDRAMSFSLWAFLVGSELRYTCDYDFYGRRERLLPNVDRLGVKQANVF